MAIKFGFFNSVGGDRKYNAEDIGNYLMGIVSSGVYADTPTSLQVLSNDGMEVEVQPGRAMLHYHYMESDSPLAFTLDNGGTQDRVDAIVARLDKINRICEIVVKKGTEAAKPTAPAMERSDTVKEYMLASVYITKLATSITQTNITDTRPDSTVCGFVTGVIDQVDTSALFAQWKAAYDEAVAEMEEWYAGLTGNYVDGSGLPIPTAGDAGKIPHVNETGNGYVLLPAVKTDDTLSQPGLAADAAATGLAIRRAAPTNLLDNSDFRNPVNQRGFAGGTPGTDNAYFIDRWKTQQSATKNINISMSDAGLAITVSTALAGIAQRIPKPKTGVTFAAKANGKISLVYAGYGVDESVKTEDDVLLYVEWLDDVLQVIIRNTGEDANTYTVEWAALYEGEYTAETLPEYQPKGYGAELAECQRYFYRMTPPPSVGVILTGHCYTAEQARFVLLYPHEMRVRPTFTYSSAGNDRLIQNNTQVNAGGVSFLDGSGSYAILGVAASGLTQRAICGLSAAGSVFAFSADL